MSLHLVDSALGPHVTGNDEEDPLEEMESLAPQFGLQKHWALWFH